MNLPSLRGWEKGTTPSGCMDLLLEVIFALEYEVQLSEKLLIAWNDFFVQVESCHKQEKLDMTALGQMRSLVLEAEGMWGSDCC